MRHKIDMNALYVYIMLLLTVITNWIVKILS